VAQPDLNNYSASGITGLFVSSANSGRPVARTPEAKMRISIRMRWLVIALLFSTSLAIAGETVGVSGSNVRYSTAIDVQVWGKPVHLALTGAALRKRGIFSVYTIASYLQESVMAKTAEQLAAADSVKLLFLVMERDVSGRDMAEAIQTGIRLNHPAEAFSGELTKMAKILGAIEIRKGDQVKLTALPRVGLRCEVIGKADVLLENPAFARAVWDIYLGRQNIGDSIKAGLTSRL
jgi:hypothetical protein